MSSMPPGVFWPSRDDPLTLANFRRRLYAVRRTALLLVGSESEWPELRHPRHTPEGNRTARFVKSPSHDESAEAGRRWSPLCALAIVRLTGRYCRVLQWKVNVRVRHVPPLVASDRMAGGQAVGINRESLSKTMTGQPQRRAIHRRYRRQTLSVARTSSVTDAQSVMTTLPRGSDSRTLPRSAERASIASSRP
jgi:hypothetical protein